MVFAYIHTLFILYGIPHEGRGVARNSAGNAFFDVFVSCCVSKVCCGKKYKAYILKYKALILKYMARNFHEVPCVFPNIA